MNDKEGFYVMGIVAIIAVVGIVLMTTISTNNSNKINNDNLGHAIAAIDTSTKSTCKDSDNGANFLVKGYSSGITLSGTYVEHVDTCLDIYTEKNLREGYCSNNKLLFTNKSCKSIGPGYYCNNGACIKTPCTDSDGGLNYTVLGTTIGYYPVQGNVITFKDECLGTNVREGYCDANGNADIKEYTCQYGCSNGACNPASCTNECNSTTRICAGYATYKQCGNYDSDPCLEWSTSQNCAQNQLCYGADGSCIPQLACNETDGGYNPAVVGYAYGTFQQWIPPYVGRDIYLTGAQPNVPNGLPYNRWPDHCYQQGNLSNQVEVQCVNNTLVNNMMYCANGCSNGVCNGG